MYCIGNDVMGVARNIVISKPTIQNSLTKIYIKSFYN